MYVTEAIDAYLARLKADGRAQSTLDNQATFMRKLRRAVREWERQEGKRTPMQVREIDHKLVTLYLAECNGGAGNKGNMLVALKQLLGYCERSDLLKPGSRDKLMHGIRAGHYERQRKVYIDAADFPKMLDCQAHPVRRMAMALLVYTLCRRSEIEALRLGDVNMDTLTIDVWRSKTQRTTPVGICPELKAELDKYLAWYAEEADLPYWDIDLMPDDWKLIPRLIPHRHRGPNGEYENTTYTIDPLESPRHMEHLVKRGLSALGITETRSGRTKDHLGEGAHTIRRSGARALLKNLSPKLGYADALVTVSAMLDHQDVKVTLRYIGMDKQKDDLNNWLRSNSMYS